MWSSRPTRRRVLGASAAAAALAVTGCGFAPAFGPGGAAGDLFGTVALPSPENQDSLALNTRLAQRLGNPANPAWQLSYDLTTSQQGFSASGEDRFQIIGTLTYQLNAIAPLAAAPLSGRVTAFSAYNEGITSASNTNTLVATQAAKRDARTRMLVQLADKIVADVIAQSAKRTAP